MDNAQSYLEEQEFRATVYGLLSRIFRTEVDQAFYDALAAFCADEALAGEAAPFSEGLARMRGYFANAGLNPLTDLAVDYARVFLGAGIADGSAAYPYESVYTSKEGLMMQEARDEVLAMYRAWGLGRLDNLVEPEDHLAFELEFMMFLVQQEAEAAVAGDEERTAEAREAQAVFVRDHLNRWTGKLFADVDRYGETGFYKAAALMTREFLAAETALLGGEEAVS